MRELLVSSQSARGQSNQFIAGSSHSREAIPDIVVGPDRSILQIRFLWFGLVVIVDHVRAGVTETSKGVSRFPVVSPDDSPFLLAEYVGGCMSGAMKAQRRAAQAVVDEDESVTPFGTCSAQNRSGSIYAVIPSEIRDAYDIKQGTELSVGYHSESGTILITPSGNV
jgi:hypothetical protein